MFPVGLLDAGFRIGTYSENERITMARVATSLSDGQFNSIVGYNVCLTEGLNRSAESLYWFLQKNNSLLATGKPRGIPFLYKEHANIELGDAAAAAVAAAFAARGEADVEREEEEVAPYAPPKKRSNKRSRSTNPLLRDLPDGA
jgi:hypothetical protein